jgi:hypothetical protein
MAKRLPIQDEYEQCVPDVPDDCSGLRLHYAAHVDAHRQLGAVWPALRRVIGDFNSRSSFRLDVALEATDKRNDHDILEVRIFARDANRKEAPLKSSQLKEVAHLLSSYGLMTQAASFYIRQCAEGNRPPQVPGTKITEAVIVPTQTVQPVLPAATAPASQYRSCGISIQNNTCSLRYQLTSPDAQALTNDYKQFRSRIQQAVNQIPSRQNGANIEVQISNAVGGKNHFANMYGMGFKVEFLRKRGVLKENLLLADVTDIAHAIHAAGCLNANDAWTMLAEVNRAATQPGWVPTP